VIPAAFEYSRATTLDEAIGLLSDGGEDAKLLAGGHSLLPLMKLRLAAPTLLVDIGRLADLSIGTSRPATSFAPTRRYSLTWPAR